MVDRSSFARSRARSSEGQFQPKYSDEAFLEAVSRYEPAGTVEVAQAVGCARQAALYRLEELREVGAIRGKLTGGSFIWMSSGVGPQ